MDEIIVLIEDDETLLIAMEGDETIIAEMVEQGPPGIQGPPGSTDIPTITVLAAIPLGGHRVITLDGVYADNTIPDHAFRVAGITTGAVAAGDYTAAIYLGEITEPTWNWDPEKPLFLGQNGLLTQDCPATGFILIVAVPVDAHTIRAAIREPTQRA